LKKFLYKVKKNGEVFTGNVVSFDDNLSKEELDKAERDYLENLSKEKGKTFLFKDK